MYGTEHGAARQPVRHCPKTVSLLYWKHNGVTVFFYQDIPMLTSGFGISDCKMMLAQSISLVEKSCDQRLTDF